MRRTRIKSKYTDKTITPVDTSQTILYRAFVDALKDDDLLWVTYEHYGDVRREEQINFFWVVRDRYANGLLMDKEIVRRQIERRWGVTVPFFDLSTFTPPSRGGRFIEMDGEIHFHISTKEYTKAELSRMIDGTLNECIENSIDIEDLMEVISERDTQSS